MKVVVTNSVPLNGGDEALLLSLIKGIKDSFPHAQIFLLCNAVDNVKKYINYIPIYSDWEYTVNRSPVGAKEKLFVRIRSFLNKFGIHHFSSLSTFFATKYEKDVIGLYKEADYVVSSAGGYIHDFYGYHSRMKAYLLALRLNKKLVFLGQSMGPFTDEYRKEHMILKTILKRAHHIYLRENISKKHLKSIGYEGSNISVTTDIAFTLYDCYKHLSQQVKKTTNKVVLSFREWSYGIKTDALIGIALQIIEFVLAKGYEVHMLSTCQGIPEYVDDSKLAELIADKVYVTCGKQIVVNHDKYNPDELILEYSKYDAYIGMRLHGAILSMVGGTPAFCIGYEDKSEGIFDFLGLSQYHSCYDEKIDTVIGKIDSFLKQLPMINLESVLEKASDCAKKDFEVFK